MSSQIETIVNAYKTLSKVPFIAGGKLNKDGNRISCKWSVRNLDKGKYTKYHHDYILDSDLMVTAQSEFGVDVTNELLTAVSPKGTFKAVIREEKEAKDVKKQYLEVWSRHNLAHCMDLSLLDIHGDVYADSEFGSLDWSHDERSLVYVAEKKLKKSEPYIKRKSEDKTITDGSGESAPKIGEECLYRQDWGEQLVGKHLSVVVVCKPATESFTVLKGLPDSWCPGQVRFDSDDQSVVGVAWETKPRRHGLIFCSNRPSFIFHLTLDGIMSKISSEGLAVRSPRVLPDGGLVWLQRAADGPHHACHALVTRKNGAEVSTVIDIVPKAVEIASGGTFHGIYSQGLPVRCFASEGRIVFSTPQRNEIRTYVADIDGGRIVDISNKSLTGSISVLDVSSDVIIASRSSMSTPAQLYVARLPVKGSEADIKWIAVTKPSIMPESLAKSTVQYMELEHDNQDSVRNFTALYFAPEAEGKKLPLVVWPHGGPHSGFVNAYSLETALFNTLGFASIRINYRGSTGAGDASVRFLPKRAGDADVKDCKLATDEALKAYPIEPTKLCLFGGSHGGFLVTHLSGQYPDFYKVVVSRNPVVDIASMFNSTDIADWCAVEAGFSFTEKGSISEEELIAMRRCSPLAYVHLVKAPTALMLGSGDKRVPPYQGLEYSRRLKANGVQTRVYMYEDNHSLSSLPVEIDNLINSVDWFLTHLNTTSV